MAKKKATATTTRPAGKAKTAAKAKPKPAPAKPFPIAGIGASAGGVEAISAFLGSLPADVGMAYVVIQHLPAGKKSLLPKLLQKHTSMKVSAITDKMPVAPNQVYVASPDNLVGIANGMLSAAPRPKTDKVPHPIDYFLFSLASAYQNKAIAIILSGTGNDGTAGVQAIKAEGGITFSQDASAAFHAMSENAVETGYVDFVLPPDQIARELAALAKHPYPSSASDINRNERELRKIHMMLHNKHNVDFSHYKQTTIDRRILRRMALNRLKSLEEYTKLMRENSTEIDLLYKDLLINVTSFFREPVLYQALSKKIFPALLKGRKPSDPLRIWVPACSTGEEACSIAICLFEYLGDKSIRTPIQIFATDLSESAIETARAGIYPKSALQNVSPQRLKRFFIKVDGNYQIIKPIRDACIFATHNLLKDPPFSRMDLISCQNVLIYLESNPQKKILQAFHYALKPAGFLVLGKSETIGNATDMFEQVDKDLKIYSKKAVSTNLHFDFSIRSQAMAPENNHESEKMVNKQALEVDIEKEADKLLLSQYVPACVVVNKDLQIVRFNGPTMQYLQPASGKASLHLMKMVRDELVFELRSLLHRAKKEGRAFSKEGIHLPHNGYAREITLEVVPLKSPAADQHFLILFREGQASPFLLKENPEPKNVRKDSKDRRITILEQELREAREHIKSMSEEFEATREELQSSNEEVLSSNEELQSINEELETSKEELQSTNEELTTINEELHHRVNDLKEAVEYTEAIVETMREPLLVLNADMRIRSANRAFYSMFKMNPNEVEGLNFYEIGNRQWNIPELKKQLNEINSTNKSFQNFELTHDFQGLGVKSLLFNATRMDREDKKNRILLAIEDITQRKKGEESLKESEERFRLLVQNSSDITTIFSEQGVILYLSESIEQVLGYKPKELIGKNIFKKPIIHPDDVHIKQSVLENCRLHPGENFRAEYRIRHKDGSYRIMEAIYSNLLQNASIGGIVSNYRDVTERRMLENQKDEFIGIASHELKTPVTSIKAYVEILQDMLQEVNDAKITELIGKLDKQVGRLTILIKDLLDATKINKGQLFLNQHYFDLNELVQETVEDLKATAPGHQLETALGPVDKIWGDRERIGQVLVNLISNAIKYSPGADKVIVRSAADAGKVTIAVQDFGIGMAEGMETRVFDRFFRVNDPTISTFPGLGLGLFIAADIVKRHGGTIGVKSVKNKGSEFYFTLPLNPADNL